MNLKFQLDGGIQSLNAFTFFSAVNGNTEEDLHLTSWLNEWEKWEFVDPSDSNSTSEFNYNQEIGIKNLKWAVYLTVKTDHTIYNAYTSPLQGNGTSVLNDQRWKLLLVGDYGSNRKVQFTDTFIIQSRGNNKYIKVNLGTLNIVSMVNTRAQATQFRFILESVV